MLFIWQNIIIYPAKLIQNGKYDKSDCTVDAVAWQPAAGQRVEGSIPDRN